MQAIISHYSKNLSQKFAQYCFRIGFMIRIDY